MPGSFLAEPSDPTGSSKLQTPHSFPELPSAAPSLAEDGICDVAQFVPTPEKISPRSTEYLI